MELKIIRNKSSKTATLSTWYTNGVLECVGLEDVVRGNYLYGGTAIPAGRYRILITRSTRFSKNGIDVFTPQLVDLPGKNTLFGNLKIDNCGIRIHPGNFPADTLGCLLPGTVFGKDNASVLSSQIAYKRLYAKITTAIDKDEPVYVTIV